MSKWWMVTGRSADAADRARQVLGTRQGMRTVVGTHPEFFYVLIGDKHGATWRRGMQKDYGVRFGLTSDSFPAREFDSLDILVSLCGQECYGMGGKQVHEAACPKCHALTSEAQVPASVSADQVHYATILAKPRHRRGHPVIRPGYASKANLPTQAEIAAKHGPIHTTKMEVEAPMERPYERLDIDAPLEPSIAAVQQVFKDWRKEVSRAKPLLLQAVEADPGIGTSALLRTKMRRFGWRRNLREILGHKEGGRAQSGGLYRLKHIARTELLNEGKIRVETVNGRGGRGKSEKHYLVDAVSAPAAPVAPAPMPHVRKYPPAGPLVAPSPVPVKGAPAALLSNLRVLEHEATEVLDRILKAIDIVGNAGEILTELGEIERRREELLARLPANLIAKDEA
jgi:hypothetical protein